MLGSRRRNDAEKAERPSSGFSDAPRSERTPVYRGKTSNMSDMLAEIKKKQTEKAIVGPGGKRQIHVRIPKDAVRRRFIDLLAKHVANEGHQFEEGILRDIQKLSQEGHAISGEFGFVTQSGGDDGIYYRWRMLAFKNGDSLKRWRTDPFQISKDGAVWHPPPIDATDQHTTTGSAEIKDEVEQPRFRPGSNFSEKEQPGGSKALNPSSREAFQVMLRDLDTMRNGICEAMAFSLDHADSAIAVVKLLTANLMEQGCTSEQGVARLFLISDILHNCGNGQIKNAWVYRREFESLLPEFCEMLHMVIRIAGDGALHEQRINSKVMAAFKSWEEAAIFGRQYLRGLEASFLRDVVPVAILDVPKALRSSLKAKIADWQGLHFSQLEKMAKTHGMRWSTPVLGSSTAERRQEWLIDRLALHEVYEFETEEEIQREIKAREKEERRLAREQASLTNVLRSMLRKAGEALAQAQGALPDLETLVIPEVDGEPLSPEELACEEPDDIDGEPMEVSRSKLLGRGARLKAFRTRFQALRDEEASSAGDTTVCAKGEKMKAPPARKNGGWTSFENPPKVFNPDVSGWGNGSDSDSENAPRIAARRSRSRSMSCAKSDSDTAARRRKRTTSRVQLDANGEPATRRPSKVQLDADGEPTGKRPSKVQLDADGEPAEKRRRRRRRDSD